MADAFVSMLEEMEAESKKGGAFFKMEPTDEKRIVILTDPEKGISNFDRPGADGMITTPDGKKRPPRTIFRMKVMVEGTKDELIWEFGHRSIMQQLVAIAKQNRLQTFRGAHLLVKTSGTDNKNRAWFLMMTSPPQAAPAQAPSPASVLPEGQNWLESQRVGAL
ncbi:MAG: hypothetical protein WCZ26_02880 [Methanothrix soehngenii]|jgi:hypothetical protein|nr:hypothetical protein [Methanothrix soehngenii]